jgi:hypothetical protein
MKLNHKQRRKKLRAKQVAIETAFQLGAKIEWCLKGEREFWMPANFAIVRKGFDWKECRYRFKPELPKQRTTFGTMTGRSQGKSAALAMGYDVGIQSISRMHRASPQVAVIQYIHDELLVDTSGVILEALANKGTLRDQAAQLQERVQDLPRDTGTGRGAQQSKQGAAHHGKSWQSFQGRWQRGRP